MFNHLKRSKYDEVRKSLAYTQSRFILFDEICGIGLWDAVLYKGDLFHDKSLWNWSSEFRKLIGFKDEIQFPNVIHSFSARIHPDDATITLFTMRKSLEDKSGKARFNMNYRLETAEGSYRWFKTTGGCLHSSDGRTIKLCGSLVDLDEEMQLEERRRPLSHQVQSLQHGLPTTGGDRRRSSHG